MRSLHNFNRCIFALFCLLVSGCVAPVAGSMSLSGEAGEGIGGESSGGINTGGINTGGVSVGGDSSGNTVPTSGGSTTMMGGEEVAGDVPSGRCTPGEPIALCLECGPENTERVPTWDDGCDPIDCDSFKRYEVSNEGGVITCREASFENGPSICQGREACYREAIDYCVFTEAEVVLTSDDLGECILIGGCSDEEAPFELIDVGAPCRDGAGVCDDQGECVVESCDGLFDISYNNNNELCADEASQGYCEFLVNSGGNQWNPDNNISCRTFCEEQGATCLEAWGEEEDSCRKANSKGCGERFTDSICRCSIPG